MRHVACIVPFRISPSRPHQSTRPQFPALIFTPKRLFQQSSGTSRAADVENIKAGMAPCPFVCRGGSHVKPKQNYVAVLHHVVFSLGPHHAGLTGRRLGAEPLVVGKVDRFGANKSVLEV